MTVQELVISGHMGGTFTIRLDGKILTLPEIHKQGCAKPYVNKKVRVHLSTTNGETVVIGWKVLS